MGGKLAAKIRWKIAYRLDRLPAFCWANLVDWALSSRAERRKLGYGALEHLRVDSLCRRDAQRNGACYCNKVRQQPEPAEPPAVST